MPEPSGHTRRTTNPGFTSAAAPRCMMSSGSLVNTTAPYASATAHPGLLGKLVDKTRLTLPARTVYQHDRQASPRVVAPPAELSQLGDPAEERHHPVPG